MTPTPLGIVLRHDKTGFTFITREDLNHTAGLVQEMTAARELSALVKWGIIERHGRTGRGTVYVLKGSNDSSTTHKRLNEDIRK